MEDVKVREMQIFDFKKKIAEAETKLKQQQNLYEAVRSDRNLYSKNLIESQVCTYATMFYLSNLEHQNIFYLIGRMDRLKGKFIVLK